MRNLLKIILAVSCFSNAFADEAAGKVFRANEGKELIGYSLKNEKCRAHIRDYSMVYSFIDKELENANGDFHYGNTISAGHLHKKIFSNKLVAEDFSWKLFEKVGELVIEYDTKLRIKSIISYDAQNNITGGCRF